MSNTRGLGIYIDRTCPVGQEGSCQNDVHGQNGLPPWMSGSCPVIYGRHGVFDLSTYWKMAALCFRLGSSVQIPIYCIEDT